MIFLNFLAIQESSKTIINLMKELFIAVGLLFFIEGILYALFPSKMKNMLKMIEQMPINQLRISGLFFAIIGFVIVWYLRG